MTDKDIQIETEIARFAIGVFVKTLKEKCYEELPEEVQTIMHDTWGDTASAFDLLDYAESLLPKDEKMKADTKGLRK